MLHICYVTNSNTNKYNKYIATYLKNWANQTMKLGHLIEYKVRTIFLKNSSRQWGKKSSTRPLFLKKNSFILIKNNWLGHLSFNIFSNYPLWHTTKTNCIKLYNVHPEMLSVHPILIYFFLKKGLGLQSWS